MPTFYSLLLLSAAVGTVLAGTQDATEMHEHWLRRNRRRLARRDAYGHIRRRDSPSGTVATSYPILTSAKNTCPTLSEALFNTLSQPLGDYMSCAYSSSTSTLSCTFDASGSLVRRMPDDSSTSACLTGSYARTDGTACHSECPVIAGYSFDISGSRIDGFITGGVASYTTVCNYQSSGTRYRCSYNTQDGTLTAGDSICNGSTAPLSASSAGCIGPTTGPQL